MGYLILVTGIALRPMYAKDVCECWSRKDQISYR
ncbi:hypothetical protein ABIB34_002283 [Rhodococcus sp. UYP5]